MLAMARPGSVFIVIIPLESRMQDLAEHFGDRAIYLNAYHRSPALIEDVRAGKYSLVFLSPGTAAGDRMERVWLDSGFVKRGGGIIVEEAHSVVEMGTAAFRANYDRIGRLKRMLVDIPILAMTATLPEAHLEDLRFDLNMRNAVVLNYGSARPEIRLHAVGMRRTTDSYVDLLTVMPDLVAAMASNGKTCRDLSEFRRTVYPFEDFPSRTSEFAKKHVPTVIFLDGEDNNYDMAYLLDKWYENAGEKGAVASFSVYNTPEHRRRVGILFEQKRILCVVCTNEMLMGMDLLNAGRIIQWQVGGSTACGLWHRIGSAVRPLGSAADAYIIIEPRLQPKEVKARFAVDKRNQQYPSSESSAESLPTTLDGRENTLSIDSPANDLPTGAPAEREVAVSPEDVVPGICRNALSGLQCMTEAFLSAVQASGVISPTPNSLYPATIKLPESCTCSVCIPHEMPWVPFAPVVVRAQPDNLPALAKTLETKLEDWGTQRWRESWKKLVPRSLDSGPDSFVGQVASRTIAGLASELVKADADIDLILADRTNIIHFELIRGDLAVEVSRLIDKWRLDTASGATNPVT